VWPFRKRTLDEVRGYRRVKINGMRFVIKKLNPFLDFKDDKIPQIFTEHKSIRPVDPKRMPTAAEVDRMYKDMAAVIEVGVVEIIGYGPVSKQKDTGITCEDLFRDPELGFRLYLEIINHSSNRFRGLRGVFFSLKNRLLARMLSRHVMANAQLISSSRPVSVR
jgi:hypothetical protein